MKTYLQSVLLKSGAFVRREIMLYGGAALIGDPTAYFLSNGAMIWVRPGQSVDWIEA